MQTASPTLPELHVNLDALIANYAWFAQQASGAQTSAAVKANAYGLGLDAVAPILLEAGCTSFFTAHLVEAVHLRKLLGNDPVIYVLHGPLPSDASTYHDYQLRPVLNSGEQLQTWRQNGANWPAAIHIDTGINRLGVRFDKFEQSDIFDLNISLMMSHLACSAYPDHLLNQTQLKRFQKIISDFPGIPASLSNSGGVLLGSRFHFDQVRIGIGLYGGSPVASRYKRPDLLPVAEIFAPIIQTRTLAKGETIGYDATFEAKQSMQIAIIAYGYADGLFCSASPGGFGRIDGVRVPLLGKVSMDLMAIDITGILGDTKPGDFVQFWGADLDTFAEQTKALNYELLTSISPRVRRIYKGAIT